MELHNSSLVSPSPLPGLRGVAGFECADAKAGTAGETILTLRAIVCGAEKVGIAGGVIMPPKRENTEDLCGRLPSPTICDTLIGDTCGEFTTLRLRGEGIISMFSLLGILLPSDFACDMATSIMLPGEDNASDHLGEGVVAGGTAAGVAVVEEDTAAGLAGTAAGVAGTAAGLAGTATGIAGTAAGVTVVEVLTTINGEAIADDNRRFDWGTSNACVAGDIDSAALGGVACGDLTGLTDGLTTVEDASTIETPLAAPARLHAVSVKVAATASIDSTRGVLEWGSARNAKDLLSSSPTMADDASVAGVTNVKSPVKATASAGAEAAVTVAGERPRASSPSHIVVETIG